MCMWCGGFWGWGMGWGLMWLTGPLLFLGLIALLFFLLGKESAKRRD